MAWARRTGASALAVVSLLLVVGGGTGGGARGAEGPPVDSFARELGTAIASLDERRGKPEAVAPLAKLAWLDESVPAGATEAAMRRAAGPGNHPLVAAQATMLLAHQLEERGDDAGAHALRAPLHALTKLWVVGPFGEGRGGFSQEFPPETDQERPSRAHSYKGKLGIVSWRAAEGAVREGALLVDALVRPDSQTTAYVAAFVNSPREQVVAVRLGSPGPTKVWVGGALVYARDVVRAPAFDQDAAAARLRKGWNRILVKTVITEGAWWLHLRVTDAAGHALDLGDGALPDGAVLVAPKSQGKGRSAGGVETLEGDLRRHAEAAPAGAGGAEAWLDLGRTLAWNGSGDRDAREAATAVETAIARQPSIAAYRLLSAVARDDDERRRAFESALALTEKPDDDAAARRATRAILLARLGETARAQRRDAVALARWREALETDPGCWTATLALADEEAAAGLPLIAVARVEALPASARAVPRVRRALAHLLDGAGRTRDADALLATLLTERRRDVDLLHLLSQRARTRGDGVEALARLRDAADLRPDLSSLELELARAVEGAGDRPAALARLSNVAARLPEDAGVQTNLGKLLRRSGRRAEALARLSTATTLRPQDPELRRYVETFAQGAPDDKDGRDAGEGGAEAKSAEDLARRFAADARALLGASADPPAPGERDADAAVLLDRRVVRVHVNGLSQTFSQRLVAIRTQHGAEDNKSFYVRYTPGEQEVEIRQARVYRRGPKGALEILEAAERDDQDLSEPWYGLYYDNRAEVVRFEGLRAGDVLEVQYVVDDVSAQNQLADYFGDFQTIAESIPKRRWEYTLLAPASRPIYGNTPKVPRLEHHQTTDGDGERVYTYAVRDVAAIEPEPAMPGLAEIAPYLHVSTYASWDDVGKWYWRLVEEQLAPDDDLRKAARGAVGTAATDLEKTRAIHDLVVKGTRYVGLEFGIHGFKPYKVTQVLARRFGDCKDKASLLYALLREVGVESELVLVRTRRGGLVASAPASLAVFDHAIVYVPKLDLYLDGTAEFSGTSELPTQDQGVMVLRVGPRGAKLVQTPVLPPATNRVERKWQVAVDAHGDAHVDETLRIDGAAAPDWRAHYQTPGERAERYGHVWTARSPGARLVSVDMPQIENRDAPVTVRAVAEVPRLGVAGNGGSLTLPLAVREGDFARTYARLSTRREDLVIDYPWQHEEDITYHLPPGWSLRDGPAPREVSGPFGRLAITVTREGAGVVHVRSRLDVTRARVSAADYPAFRTFLGDIDSVFAGRVVVAPEATK